MVTMESFDHFVLEFITYTWQNSSLKVRKMPKSHWRSAFPEELGKFRQVIEVDSEPFNVREFAGMVKVHQNGPEFFRVEA